jgi:hypothetical protein
MLLESIVAYPDSTVEALEMVTSAERVQQQREVASQHESQRRRLKIARRQVIVLDDKPRPETE